MTCVFHWKLWNRLISKIFVYPELVWFGLFSYIYIYIYIYPEIGLLLFSKINVYPEMGLYDIYVASMKDGATGRQEGNHES